MSLWDDSFTNIAAEFEAQMPGLAPVTVTQIDPDSGSVTATAENVMALKRSRRRQPFGVSGGELGSDQCRFVFRADQLSFSLKARDEVTDADSVVWVIEGVQVIGFQQLAAVDVSLKRS